MQALTITPKVNSIAIADPLGLQVMGQSPYGTSGIQHWQYPNKYYQKVCFDDSLAIQVHTQRTASTPLTTPPNLYLCDGYYFDHINQVSHFHVVGASAWDTTTGATHNLNAAPYLKGQQAISGNNYTDPFDHTVVSLATSMWAFSFTDLSISTRGIYYLMMENYSVTPTATTRIFSEPMAVTDYHPNTILFQSQFNANDQEKNIVVTGWYDDYPTNTVPYTPVFSLRCEGFVIDDNPKVINVGYLQQSYDQNQITTRQKRMKKLSIGELSTGIPPYMLEMATEQILSDLWVINNYSYIVFNPSAQSSLADLWKVKQADPWTLRYASTTIMERFAAQGAIGSPFSPFSSRIFTAEFDDAFA